MTQGTFLQSREVSELRRVYSMNPSMCRLAGLLLVGMTPALKGCAEPTADDGVFPMPIIPFVIPNPDAFGLAYENLALKTANGETIYAWFIPADSARATILIHHGAMFSRSWPLPQVAQFHELGCNVMIADYQGFGNSTGTASLDTLLSDADTSLAYVRDHPRQGTDRIVLFGVSMGTMIAMAQAADAPPDVVGMMVEGTVELESLEDIGYQFMGIPPSPDAPSFVPAELDPLLTAPRITIPKLYLQSLEDAITPYAGAKRLFDHSPEPKQMATIIGMHGFGLFIDPGYVDIVNNFLDEVAPPTTD